MDRLHGLDQVAVEAFGRPKLIGGMEVRPSGCKQAGKGVDAALQLFGLDIPIRFVENTGKLQEQLMVALQAISMPR